MTPHPSGTREHRDGVDYLVFTRTFRAPIESVWAAVTEPGRLERWIGTWTGDPASGEVTFTMTAEGVGAPDEVFQIDTCDPPRRLRTTSGAPGGEGQWTVDLQLVEHDGSTTLTFAQQLTGAVDAREVGPGWEYYLDRLVIAESGGDVGAIDFAADYYPVMSDYYGEPPG